jgi:hypothetical protein
MGRGLLKADRRRHVRNPDARRDREEFRVRPELEPGSAEDPVTDRELFDGGGDGADLSRKLGAEDPMPRPADA